MHKAGIVHADLSEFNILNYNNNPVFIDFSQGTIATHPRYFEYLKRDVANVCRFFKKLGVKAEPAEILEKILEE